MTHMNSSTEAIENWRRRIRESTSANYHYCMGVALEQESLSAAADAYRRAIDADVMEFRAFLRLRDLLEKAGDAPGAALLHRQALDADPFYEGNGAAALARDEATAGKTEEAWRLLNEAIARQATDVALLAEVAETVGNQFRQARRTDEAVRCYEAAIGWNPDSAGVHLGLAEILHIQGDLQQALQHAQACVRLQPDWPDALYLMGNVALLERQWDDALSWLQQALNHRFRSPSSIHSLMGSTLMAAGRLPEALQHIDLSLEKNAGDSQMIGTRGIVLMRLGRVAEANARLASLVSQIQNDPYLRTVYALTLTADGKPEAGLEQIDIALGLLSSWSLTLCGRAYILLRLGRREEAVEAMRAARHHEPLWVDFSARVLFNEPDVILGLVNDERSGT